MLAWAVGDLSKLPFSDDVTSESRVLINRNIREIVNGVAPFLIYDNDPYIVVSNDGRLFWIIDAFTESSNLSVFDVITTSAATRVNYIRNSVKVVIDAYNGTTHFYVFDQRGSVDRRLPRHFPGLVPDASQMPADLRAHVRYPETLMRAQGEVYGLYHTQNAKCLFPTRRRLERRAADHASTSRTRNRHQPIDPYFVLMQLPGEQKQNEFVLILPFTPANRNNMIGWMAGRSDGENYGKLLVYNFPKSRLIDGPLQIEARIDQNAQLSAQFTLWNQQGSRVMRGHLLVIPMGRSLLYVEPIYLQAVNSPMPELRLVVLATQEKLAFGQSFDEAMTNLFGEARKPTSGTETGQSRSRPTERRAQSRRLLAAATRSAQLQQLINRAVQEFEDYQKLTAAGN